MQSIGSAGNVSGTDQPTLSNNQKKTDISYFDRVLSRAEGQGKKQGNGFPAANSTLGYIGLWNSIAIEKPELLESDVSRGNYTSLKEARAADIRKKLVGAGVDLATANIIANREAGTVVRRPDNSRPGPGVSGYHGMPESIRSEAVSENSQVREGTGYAYVDRYGFSHVSTDLASALNFSGDGKVYEYEGRFGGGYPLDKEDSRAILDLPQVRMYSNAQRIAEAKAEEEGNGAAPKLPGPPAGKVQSVSLTEEYIKSFAQNIAQGDGSFVSIGKSKEIVQS